MKAKDSVKNYPSALREMSNYSVRSVKKICTDIGGRKAGSEQELEAQKRMAAELESCCDSVATEQFSVYPGAYTGWSMVCGILMTAAAVLFCLGMSAVSLALSVVSLISVTFGFIMYSGAFDALFPKKTSQNIVAVKAPSGEIKRRIILSGSCDSTTDWRFAHKGSGSVKVLTAFNVIGIVLVLAASVWGVAAGHAFSAADSGALFVMRFVPLAFIPVFVVTIFFENKKSVSLGAVNNLSGCFAAMSVLKFLERHDLSLENTEISVLLTGSKQAAARGAKAYCKAHGKELEDVETVFIGFDSLRDAGELKICSADSGLSALLEGSAVESGVNAVKGEVCRMSDAAAVSKAGIRAAVITADDPSNSPVWHGTKDAPEALDIKTVEAAIGIVLETVFAYDEKGE